MTPRLGNVLNRQIHGDREGVSGCQGLGGRVHGGACQWEWGFLLGWWNVLEQEQVRVSQRRECTECHLDCLL